MRGDFIVVAVGLCACADVEPLGISSAEQPLALQLPVVLPVQPFVDAPTIGQLYGSGPDFSVNIPGFDSLNRAYIRERWYRKMLARTPQFAWSTGSIQRQGQSGWEQYDFDFAIRMHFGWGSEDVCYVDGGGDQGAQIVFDRDDRAYTVLQAKACSGGRVRTILLHSSDYGATWQVVELPSARMAAFERPHSPDPLEGPPAVLLFDGLGTAEPCGDTAGWYGRLRLVKPVVRSGRLSLLPAVDLSASSMHIGSHSGGSTMVLTQGGRIYAVWGEVRTPSHPTGCLRDGSPVKVAAFSVGTSSLEGGATVDVDVSKPTNDGHNRPAMLMDTAGHLHIVVGSHNCPFRYVRSTRPRDIASWSASESTIAGVDIDDCTHQSSVPVAKQTYVAFARDRDDRFHLAYRRVQDDADLFPANRLGYTLAYQRKEAGAAWSPVKQLIQPPQASYGIYYHQLSIDHYGHPYLLLSYYAGRDPAHRWFHMPPTPEGEEPLEASPELYKYGAILTSADHGENWSWASSQAFADAQFWEPSSSAMGDLDGDGLDDMAHVYYKHGLNVRTDYARADGWRPHGRWLGDGDGVLQFPLLAGDVDGDDDDDLVFVFRHWATNDLAIRTKFSEDHGGFRESAFEQTETGFPDARYPNLIPLMGDVTGDGLADVVVLFRTSCGLNIRTKRSLGDGRWVNSTTCHAESADIHSSLPHPPLIGRVDANPRADLVFVHRVPAGPDGIAGTADDNHLRTTVKLANAGGTWSTIQQWHGDGDGVHQYPHVLGDVDGDGYDDLVFIFRHWSGGEFSIRVKFSNGDGTFGGSRETSHPDGSQVPHYPPMIARVNGDACADLVFPHRLGAERRGTYQVRTFLAICDGSQSPQWERRTTTLP